MVCIQRQNIITRPKQRGIYIKKQNHCNMAKQHGMHQSANTILHGKSRGPYSTTEKSSCKH